MLAARAVRARRKAKARRVPSSRSGRWTHRSAFKTEAGASAIAAIAQAERKRQRLANPFQGKALGFLSVEHPLRRSAIQLVKWPWFDRVVLLFIIVNSAIMATATF